MRNAMHTAECTAALSNALVCLSSMLGRAVAAGFTRES